MIVLIGEYTMVFVENFSSSVAVFFVKCYRDVRCFMFLISVCGGNVFFYLLFAYQNLFFCIRQVFLSIGCKKFALGIWMLILFQGNFENVLTYFRFPVHFYIDLGLIFFDQNLVSKDMSSMNFFCEFLLF